MGGQALLGFSLKMGYIVHNQDGGSLLAKYSVVGFETSALREPARGCRPWLNAGAFIERKGLDMEKDIWGNDVSYDEHRNQYTHQKDVFGNDVTYDQKGNQYVSHEGLFGTTETYDNHGNHYTSHEGLFGTTETHDDHGNHYTTYQDLTGATKTYQHQGSCSKNAGMSAQKAGSGATYPYHGPVSVKVYERSTHVTRKIYVIEALLAAVAVLAAVKYLWWGVAMLVFGILLAVGIHSSFPRLSYDGDKKPSYLWAIIMLVFYGMVFADLLITVDLPIFCEDLIDYGISGCMAIVFVILTIMILGMVFRAMKNGQDVTSHYINV